MATGTPNNPESQSNFNTYLESWNNINSFKNLPCEINPNIKIEALQLCSQYGREKVSGKLRIPLSILEEWKKEYEEIGTEQMIKQHKTKSQMLTRKQKAQILQEAMRTTNGIEKVAAKYGLTVSNVKVWEAKLKGVGYKSFIKKNRGHNSLFSVEEKVDIIKEGETEKKSVVCNKYDICPKLLDIWVGRLNFFGRKGLETNSTKYNVMEYTQQDKIDIIEFNRQKGISKTCCKFGASPGNMKTWQRQLETFGKEHFLKGPKYWDLPPPKPRKRKIIERRSLLDACGLFEGVVQTTSKGGEGSENGGEPTTTLLEEGDINTNANTNINTNINTDTNKDTKNISNNKYMRGNTNTHISTNYNYNTEQDIEGEHKVGIPMYAQFPPPEYLEDYPKSASTNYMDTETDNDYLMEGLSEISKKYSHSEQEYPDITDNILGKREATEEGELSLQNFRYLDKVNLLLKDVKDVFPPIVYRDFKNDLQILLNKYITRSTYLCNHLVKFGKYNNHDN